MADELLNYWREYGAPPKQGCIYDNQEDCSVRFKDMDGACCTSDFSNLNFYVTPKNPPKLSGWKKHISK